MIVCASIICTLKKHFLPLRTQFSLCIHTWNFSWGFTCSCMHWHTHTGFVTNGSTVIVVCSCGFGMPHQHQTHRCCTYRYTECQVFVCNQLLSHQCLQNTACTQISNDKTRCCFHLSNKSKSAKMTPSPVYVWQWHKQLGKSQVYTI